MFRDLIARGLVRFGKKFVELGIQVAGAGEAQIWFQTNPDRDLQLLIPIVAIVMVPFITLAVLSYGG